MRDGASLMAQTRPRQWLGLLTIAGLAIVGAVAIIVVFTFFVVAQSCAC